MILIIINTATVSHLSIGRVNTTCPVVVVGLIIDHARGTRSIKREKKKKKKREEETNSSEIVDCVSVSLCVSRFLSFLRSHTIVVK